MLEFFDKWSNAIQAITVVFLVLITWWYSYETRKMAKTMTKEYSLSITPLMMLGRDIDRNFLPSNQKVIQLKFHYSNIEKVPIIYQTESVILNGKDITPTAPDTILLPTQTGTLFSNLYESEEIIVNQGDNLEGSIKVVWWANNISEKKYYFTRTFKLAIGVNTFILSEDFGEV